MPFVKVQTGPNKGKIFEVKEENIGIGRESTEDIQIVDQGVSRKHSEIFRIGEMCFIRDLESKNGTFVNDEKVDEELLRAGDQIRIGSTILIFEDTVAPVEKEEAKELEQKVEFISDQDIGTTIELKLDKKLPSITEGEDVETLSKALDSIYKIAKKISAEKDLDKTLKNILETSVDAVEADNGYLFLFDKKTGKFIPKATIERVKTDTHQISKTIMKQVAQFNKSILTSDASADDRFKSTQSVIMKKIKSVICVPLSSMDRVNGIMYLNSAKVGGTFSGEDFQLATAIGTITGVAFESANAIEEEKRTFLQTIKSLVIAYELRDPKMQGHSERVSNYSAAISKQMDLSEIETEKNQMAALLHDIGKVAITEKMIKELGPEKAELEHVKLGEKIVKNMPEAQAIVPAVKHHHEKIDGSGYPDKLKGEKIPLSARIIAVANEFDILTTQGGEGGSELPIKDVLMKLEDLKGIEYDKAVVQALIISHRNGTLFSYPTIFDKYS